MLDMHTRLLPVTRVGGIVGMLMAVAIVPWTNPLALVPIILGSAAMAFTIAMAGRRGDVRPIVGGVVLIQLAISGAILLNDRAGVGDLFLLVTGMVPAAGGFPGRVVTALAVLSGALMVAVGLIAGVVLASPPMLILPLLTLFSVTLLSAAIRRASIDHQRAAVIDGLTGAQNRTSLAARTEELQQQTALTGEPVAVVVADVDQFKLVNDLYGHPAGDRVLVALARLLRTRVGVRGQAYRLGGDEFGLLLPGATAAEAAQVADGIVRAARAEPLGDVPVTVSVGVAASTPGTSFSFDDVFAAADTALYQAKRGGRDAVRIARRRPALRLTATVDQPR